MRKYLQQRMQRCLHNDDLCFSRIGKQSLNITSQIDTFLLFLSFLFTGEIICQSGAGNPRDHVPSTGPGGHLISPTFLRAFTSIGPREHQKSRWVMKTERTNLVRSPLRSRLKWENSKLSYNIINVIFKKAYYSRQTNGKEKQNSFGTFSRLIKAALRTSFRYERGRSPSLFPSAAL